MEIQEDNVNFIIQKKNVDNITCLTIVSEENLKIVDIEKKNNSWVLKVQPLPEGLILREIERKDHKKVYDFLKRNANEFKPKISWEGQQLHDMVYNGLLISRWKGMAYFDKYDNIVSYFDYKLRKDGDVEIGAMLTHKDYRGQGLASSLLYFLRIKYSACLIHAGTFEENIPMRKSFQKTGFYPEMIFVNDQGEKTHLKKERCDINCKDKKNELTNSVYYITDPLV